MIIKFDQSPEEYFRLSRAAMGRKELDRAMIYGEKALRGKGTTEYKLSLAEIFLSMGRYSEAADLALDALCYGRGSRGKIYDVLARASGEMGLFYESLHYLAKKAHYEEDEDALDAMDEVMQELMDKEEAAQSPFFIVGKEKEKDDSMSMMRASFAYNHGEYREAIRCAQEVRESSPHYPAARTLILHALVKSKEDEQAIRLAEEIVTANPENAYAVYLLVDKYKKTDYLPLLGKVKGTKEELRYAITAAERLEEHGIASGLASHLLAENPYDRDVYFLAAAVALNAGEKEKSEDLLKRLFSLYTAYPATLILKGWRSLKGCKVQPHGKMPEEILRILRRHVKKGCKTSEQFLCSVLTDESYRAALSILLEEGDREIESEVLDRFGEVRNRQMDAFFTRFLIRNGVDLLVKRAILGELLFHKDKGKLPLAQSVVPMGVSCVKPLHYDLYPEALREAYVNVYSFVAAMTDGAGGERVRDFAERAYLLGLGEKEAPEIIGAAFVYRLLIEDLVPAGNGAHSAADACRFIMTYVFGVSRFSFAKVKKSAILLS